MSFVQQHDQIDSIWIKYHVETGDIVAVAPKKFDDVDELDPIKPERPHRVRNADPLRDYR